MYNWFLFFQAVEIFSDIFRKFGVMAISLGVDAKLVIYLKIFFN